MARASQESMQLSKNLFKIFSEYLTTDIDLTELAKKHGVGVRQLMDAASKEKWDLMKIEHMRLVSSKMAEQVVQDNKDEVRQLKCRELSDFKIAEEKYRLMLAEADSADAIYKWSMGRAKLQELQYKSLGITKEKSTAVNNIFVKLPDRIEHAIENAKNTAKDIITTAKVVDGEAKAIDNPYASSGNHNSSKKTEELLKQVEAKAELFENKLIKAIM